MLLVRWCNFVKNGIGELVTINGIHYHQIAVFFLSKLNNTNV